MSKPRVEVFSPSGECSCSFSTWINRVWNVLNEYGEKIEIVSLMSNSSRAEELGVGGRSVVVNGEVTAVFELERKINEVCRNKSQK
ncbi:MAG: hypothetical protein ACXADY_04745 [Candidatus Hodarchaeales archaeon]